MLYNRIPQPRALASQQPWSLPTPPRRTPSNRKNGGAAFAFPIPILTSFIVILSCKTDHASIQFEPTAPRCPCWPMSRVGRDRNLLGRRRNRTVRFRGQGDYEQAPRTRRETRIGHKDAYQTNLKY